MDSFKMSMREIMRKHTKSELAIQAWESKQKSYNMHLMFKRSKSTSSHNVKETEDGYELPAEANNGIAVPKSLIDKETGELDLRKATGPQAARYLQALGINLTVIH